MVSHCKKKLRRTIRCIVIIFICYILVHLVFNFNVYTISGFILIPPGTEQLHISDGDNVDDAVIGKSELKLVTMFVSFVDSTNISNYEYRVLTQSNFLRMTQFDCFRDDVNFIVYTNSPETVKLIQKDYPNVIPLPTILRGKFEAPMYKDAYRTAMKTTNSFFYMQVNACNLYDSSLIRTLQTVREAWRAGLIRQKIFITGQRYNLITKETVENEEMFTKLFNKAKLFYHDAQDFSIVTKDTIEWNLYPETILGRLRSDNNLVDHGVHNEVELFDATSSIRLLHQSEEHTEYSSDVSRNDRENKWNNYLTEQLRDHYSTTCARYKLSMGQDGDGAISLYDKKSSSVLVPKPEQENAFFKTHTFWLDYIASQSILTESSPSLVIVVLAYNKPESLNRLLDSLTDTDFKGDRIDLVISLDIGHMDYFDLPTLTLSKTYLWKHGKKKVVLKSQHRGELYQWIEAYDCVDRKGHSDPQIIILEDCIVLAPYWYHYLTTVSHQVKHRNVVERISGWSLEAPVTSRTVRSNVLNKFTSAYWDKSSVVLAGIKRVRSFIPIQGLWIEFVKWFSEESGSIPVKLVSGSVAAQLERRGHFTHWESGLWSSWFSYYLQLNHPNKNRLMYIFDKRGILSMKVYPTLLYNIHEDCYYLYNHALQNEHEVGETATIVALEKSPILLPDEIPNFDLDSQLGGLTI